jgi:1-deoxy-D-xylulose-5-phosphate reductoisomerase
VLTASGGPFRGRTSAQLAGISVAEALAHPTWAMGPVVTVNSATLVNKGLELIEAHLLFAVPYERIEVVVHPQSVIHSMVTFRDGSTIAQASPPDMKLPIALGLSWPDRLGDVAAACDFTRAATWTFEPVDNDSFPALRLARAAGMAGGLVPAVFNAANEQAVAAFLAEKLPFTGISHILARILEESDHVSGEPADIPDVLAAEEWARARSEELIARV